MLFRKLLYMRMLEGANVVDHVNEFITTMDSLAEVDVDVSDEMLVILLLSSLPKSYENFVVAIEARDSLPSFSSLKIKLLEEGARQNGNETTNNTVTENLMQTRIGRKFQKKYNGKAGEKNKNNNNRKCYNCGQSGHFAVNCKQTKKTEKNTCFMTQLLTYSNNRAENYVNKNAWCIDSGATSHFCCVREMFTSYAVCDENIILANQMCVRAIGCGDVNIDSANITLKNVYHVNEIPNNFISVSRATDAGMRVEFKNNFVEIKNEKNERILKAYKENGLFLYKCEQEYENKCYTAVISEKEAIKWHNRFGHVNYKCLKEMIDQKTVRGIKVKNVPRQLDCKSCAKCKITAKPFPQMSESRSNKLLQIVHSDVCGPMNKHSLGGSRFFVTFIDDYSRYISVYFIKSKDLVFNEIKDYKAAVKKQTGEKLKCLRSDNGREYLNKDFDNFLSEHGIKRQLTVAYTPQQNGIAERANRTLVEMARTMITHSGLSENF